MKPAARAILLLGAVIGAAAWATSHFDLASVDPDGLAERVRASGALGPAVLLGLLVVQSILSPLPSQPVMMAAGFVYGSTLGFAIGWAGVLMGACACFGLARIFGRPLVERFARRERIDAIDDYVSRRGAAAAFATVLSLRLFAHFSFDVVSYACGLIRFGFARFAAATALGEIPKVFLFTVLGASFDRLPGGLGWVVALGLAGTAGVVWWISRRSAPADSASS